MSTETLTFTEASLPDVAAQLLKSAQKQCVWLFEGPMGAGKTTLIKQLCEQLGVDENVTSPTFSLVNEYLTNTGETVYHFDFYRIETESEALDMGVLDYFDSGDFCFVEWPSKIPSYIPEDHAEIEISIQDDQTRTIQLKQYGEGAQ